jgi:hypothetical protein
LEFLKTQGRLVYDPIRRNFNKTWKERTLLVELPWDDLDLYYQWFLRKKFGTWFDHRQRKQFVFNKEQTALYDIYENVPCIYRPMWGRHVTIVRGDEQGYCSSNWGKHQGKIIDIFYATELECSWKFWILPVKGDNLFEFRTELGLPAFHNFHITVAREKNENS